MSSLDPKEIVYEAADLVAASFADVLGAIADLVSEGLIDCVDTGDGDVSFRVAVRFVEADHKEKAA
ncbi:hypothetical protein ACIRRA_24035 [Nocardia sp. NPDC101769]|uniref:hypothetical protein n=1 Tax=Nocardia sp. NPDC101769 TaxID=3364333 RepID=UPI00382A95E9